MTSEISIHLAVDQGVKAGSADFAERGATDGVARTANPLGVAFGRLNRFL